MSKTDDRGKKDNRKILEDTLTDIFGRVWSSSCGCIEPRMTPIPIIIISLDELPGTTSIDEFNRNKKTVLNNLHSQCLENVQKVCLTIIEKRCWLKGVNIGN